MRPFLISAIEHAGFFVLLNRLEQWGCCIRERMLQTCHGLRANCVIAENFKVETYLMEGLLRIRVCLCGFLFGNCGVLSDFLVCFWMIRAGNFCLSNRQSKRVVNSVVAIDRQAM